METESPRRSVSISPEVLALLFGHAFSHRTTPIHGALIGKASETKVEITDAFPICHETPTKFLIESSLSLVQSTLDGNTDKSPEIVGWYTAPELTHPGESAKQSPVALRVVAGLMSTSLSHPVLLALNNGTILEVLNGQKDPQTVVSVFGKDFGNQWMEKLDHKLMDPEKAVKSIAACAFDVKDLTDHWNAGAASEWTSAAKFKKRFV
ncbi:UPF0172 domain containing protein [Nitzschia inconspicua]|uniref:UPF0172 domain containing protein n=1 Tax=Nitzschia inconspicua TaxID=303405 RepID=A0A9K3KX87_9STRA|nr:UPF0172 domain containing protein [Nitzschia inconspicua]